MERNIFCDYISSSRSLRCNSGLLLNDFSFNSSFQRYVWLGFLCFFFSFLGSFFLIFQINACRNPYRFLFFLFGCYLNSCVIIVIFDPGTSVHLPKREPVLTLWLQRRPIWRILLLDKQSRSRRVVYRFHRQPP